MDQNLEIKANRDSFETKRANLVHNTFPIRNLIPEPSNQLGRLGWITSEEKDTRGESKNTSLRDIASTSRSPHFPRRSQPILCQDQLTIIHYETKKFTDSVNQNKLANLESLKNSFPTIYPFDIFTSLCIVDTIDRLGINRYFGHEIKVVLDEAYR
ncbi:hypothetical protein LguiA_002549 [Lonicera macranthoides]